SARDRGDLKAARGHLDRGLERYPQDVRMYQSLSTLELRAGRFEEATACLKRGIDAVSEKTGLKVILADLLVHTGKTKEAKEEAKEVIKRLRETGFVEEYLDFLDATLAAQEGHWVEAKTLLEDVRVRLTARPELAELNKRANLLLAECYRQIGSFDQQH